MDVKAVLRLVYCYQKAHSHWPKVFVTHFDVVSNGLFVGQHYRPNHLKIIVPVGLSKIEIG